MQGVHRVGVHQERKPVARFERFGPFAEQRLPQYGKSFFASRRRAPDVNTSALARLNKFQIEKLTTDSPPNSCNKSATRCRNGSAPRGCNYSYSRQLPRARARKRAKLWDVGLNELRRACNKTFRWTTEKSCYKAALCSAGCAPSSRSTGCVRKGIIELMVGIEILSSAMAFSFINRFGKQRSVSGHLPSFYSL